MPSLRSILAVTVLILSAPLAVGASSLGDPVAVATGEGIVALQAEVMLLVALDAYTDPIPAQLIEVHDTWSPYLEGMSRTSLIDWLVSVDADGASALDDLTKAGVIPGTDLQVALGTLEPASLAIVMADGRPAIGPSSYATALATLESASFEVVAADRADPSLGSGSFTPTTLPASIPEIGPASTIVDAPAQPATTIARSTEPGPATITQASPSATTTNSQPPVWVLGGISVVTLLSVLTFVGSTVVRRRRRVSNPGDADFDRLLEAGRRMTKALDRLEIAAIARTEAMALVDASHAAFITVDPEGMGIADASGDVLDPRRLHLGILQRIADTGQPANLVSHDEPALTALPVAILGVPVIGGGRVTGIIALIRPDERPFGDIEETLLGRLAPMVGSALAATARHDDVAALSMVDQLTALPNRRCLDRDLVASLESPGLLAVAMIDVDHFKNFNDTNGHTAGDDALRAVGAVLGGAIRKADTAYRYGGEEFTLLLRVRDANEAREVAERVRRGVETAVIAGEQHQPGCRLTISMGVAVVESGTATRDDARQALAAADAALYTAKETGRNRVVVTEPVKV